MRIGAAQREPSRSWGQIFLASGYTLVPRDLCLHSFNSTVLPPGAHHWYKAGDGLWWLSKIANRVPSDPPSDNTNIIRFLDDPGPVKINLRPPNYTTSSVAIYGSWYLQRHKTGGLVRWVVRVRYYALTDSLHVSKFIGLSCT